MPAAKEIGVERDRCRTGIEGLDTLLNGGVPRGNTVLVTGSVGTGKTSLPVQFLIHGARTGENSLYISVTESSEKLLANLIHYDFFEPRLLKEGRLIFIDLPLIYERLGLDKHEFDMQDTDILTKVIVDLVREMKTKRLAIDSVIAERLMELPEASAVSLRMKTEHYFDVVRAILDVFAPKKNLDSFYITCTIPSASIIHALQVLEIPVADTWFVA